MLRAATAAFLLVAGSQAIADQAFADEVIIHREVPVEVEPPPPPPPPADTVVIEKRVPDCRTTRTHTEDEATGESTTVTRRSCD